MLFPAFNLTNAIGAAGFLLSLVAYCVIRRIISGGQTPSRLRCSARTCVIVGILKMGIGVFEIVYFNESGGIWWGWILILFSVFWIIRGNKFRRQAANISAGYQPFNGNQPAGDSHHRSRHRAQSQEIEDGTRERRLSNAPQIVIVSSDDMQPLSSIYPAGVAAPNALSQPIMSNYDAPLIRNAVPPSPFMGTQGNDSYIVPSIIPMVPNVITTTTQPSDSIMTPRKQRTIGHMATSNDIDEVEEEEDHDNDEDNDTQQHAEDSIYIEDDDDGKNEIEPETPKGPSERKTSEGNVTFS